MSAEMKAKRVYEFHKNSDPLKSLGMGPIKEKMFTEFKKVVDKYEFFILLSGIADLSNEMEVCFSVEAEFGNYTMIYSLSYDWQTKLYTLTVEGTHFTLSNADKYKSSEEALKVMDRLLFFESKR